MSTRGSRAAAAAVGGARPGAHRLSAGRTGRSECGSLRPASPSASPSCARTARRHDAASRSARLALRDGGAAAAVAHEVRPAYLEIDQTAPQSYAVIWKQPTMGDVAIHLVPHLSNGWLETQPSDQYAAAGFLIQTGSFMPKRRSRLTARRVTIEGLDRNHHRRASCACGSCNGQRLDAIDPARSAELQDRARRRQRHGDVGISAARHRAHPDRPRPSALRAGPAADRARPLDAPENRQRLHAGAQRHAGRRDVRPDQSVRRRSSMR